VSVPTKALDPAAAEVPQVDATAIEEAEHPQLERCRLHGFLPRGQGSVPRSGGEES
jgi:hypothetical protein